MPPMRTLATENAYLHLAHISRASERTEFIFWWNAKNDYFIEINGENIIYGFTSSFLTDLVQ